MGERSSMSAKPTVPMPVSPPTIRIAAVTLAAGFSERIASSRRARLRRLMAE